MSQDGKPTVSFGFSKKSEKKIIRNDEETSKDETEFITSLEDRELKSTKPKEEKKELVIPLIKTNNWKTKHAEKIKAGKPPSDGIDSQAVNELISDAAKRNESWDERGQVDPDMQIPLLMQNKVPEGFETDDHLDVSLRPDEPEDAAYDEVPIEHFGVALLKGMGWKPGQGIGKNNKAVAPVDAVLRPKGMGLGADRSQTNDLNSAKQGGNTGNKKQDSSAELRLTKGAHCLIENGTNKDLYGTIEGLDEDNARLMVKLTISGKMVTMSQYNIKLVNADEYNKYSKYINKGAADRYKDKEAKEKSRHGGSDADAHSSDGGHRNSGREHSHDERTSSHRKKKHKHKHGHRSDEEYAGSSDRKSKHKDKRDKHKDRYTDDDQNGQPSKKRKHENDRSEAASSLSNGASNSIRSHSLWVRSNLRVRLVDENYKKGKYFNSKVVIVDVFDKDHCVCKTENGKVLEDISQSMLETVVPKSDSSYVYIVNGKHKGQIAHVMERNKKKYEALLQLLSDRDKVIQIDYDSICEYVGDINEEFDF